MIETKKTMLAGERTNRASLADGLDAVLQLSKAKESMSSIQDVSAEQLAKLFHHYQEALAQDFDCNDKQEEASWERTPSNERKLMVAAARLALLELAEDSTQESQNRKYFAKPGEADWGC